MTWYMVDDLSHGIDFVWAYLDHRGRPVHVSEYAEWTPVNISLFVGYYGA